MRKALALAVTLTALLVCSLAFAKGNPPPSSGSSGGYWTVQELISTTTQYVSLEDGDALDLLVPAGTDPSHRQNVLTMTASTATTKFRCAWLMDAGLDIDATSEIVDAAGPNESGPGGVFLVGPNGNSIENPSWSKLQLSSGSRAGLCGTPIANHAGNKITVPCAAVGDAICTTYGAGACDMTPTVDAAGRTQTTLTPFAGVWLGCEADFDRGIPDHTLTVQMGRIEQP